MFALKCYVVLHAVYVVLRVESLRIIANTSVLSLCLSSVARFWMLGLGVVSALLLLFRF